MAMQKFAVTPGFEVGGTLLRPEQLAAIGAVIGEDAKVEMTTFKQLYVEMKEERIEEAQEALKKVGLQIHPAGFYTKSLISCNFCRGAEDAGLDIARKLDEAIAGHEAPSPLKVGYAGCALGTSEPLLKDIAVVKMRDKYDIYVGGESKGLKAALAQLLTANVEEDRLIPVVTSLISDFQQNGKKKEKYSRYINRISLDHLRASSII
ncbi:nitrite reductase [Paenibacillus sp. N1-5-1-14]|uniref:nitrite reductase n=1 Tax=Paenibacillus radicibacter TaxID=2972488 RepID=UPI0021590C30|nr:nitrite reductase [Paenibacillus radicibacter]MCR8645347.1 nitrite reductase [Paenibacillus radicibacter]